MIIILAEDVNINTLPRQLKAYLRTYTYLDAKHFKDNPEDPKYQENLKKIRKHIRFAMPGMPLKELKNLKEVEQQREAGEQQKEQTGIEELQEVHRGRVDQKQQQRPKPMRAEKGHQEQQGAGGRREGIKVKEQQKQTGKVKIVRENKSMHSLQGEKKMQLLSKLRFPKLFHKEQNEDDAEILLYEMEGLYGADEESLSDNDDNYDVVM